MKFIIGYDLNSDSLIEFESEEKADQSGAQDYCVIEAPTIDQAKLNYETSFLAWQDSQRGNNVTVKTAD